MRRIARTVIDATACAASFFFVTAATGSALAGVFGVAAAVAYGCFCFWDGITCTESEGKNG